MSDSRRQFESEMTRRIRSLESLFKAFARESNGNYLREDIQCMWAGWQMHERFIAESTAVGEKA